MQSSATSVDQYISELPGDRRPAVTQLRDVIKNNLPSGYREEMSYGMIGYVVPHDLYPSGYHCNPDLPLPFMNLASQKNYIAVYHSGIYADPSLLEWFKTEYANRVPGKLDMGKSCIRFKKMQTIPFELIGELCTKMSVEEWIKTYESIIKR